MPNFTPELLELRVERALLARQRYVMLTPKSAFDIAVDQQLTNYVILLQDMAVEVGVTRAKLDEIEQGADAAVRAERAAQIEAGTAQL
jgi:hypothetical protein